MTMFPHPRRRLSVATLLSFAALAACQPGSTLPDGQGSGPDEINDGLGGDNPSGSGGESPSGSGGREPTSGGAASGGDSSDSSSGGASAPSGGAMSGGNAGVDETGGTGGTVPEASEPKWLAYTVELSDGHPLYLARSDGSVDAIPVSDGVFGHFAPSFTPDGKNLLFVEYSCCGFSNAAFELPIDGEELGTPTLIHAPLTDGEVIRYAGYSPDGRHIVARFADPPGGVGWYALRPRDADPTDWRILTPESHAGLDVTLAWSPDSASVLLVQTEQNNEKHIYRFDIDDDLTEAYEVVALESGDEVSALLWSSDSQHFAVSTQETLYLGHVSRPDLDVISSPGDQNPNLGQGGEGGQSTPAEYGPHYPLAFSSDSQQLIYGSFDEGFVLGSMRLASVDLQDPLLPTTTVLLEQKDSRDLRFSGFIWPEDTALYLGADIEVEGRFDVARIDLNTHEVTPKVRIPDGQISHGFAWVPAGIVYLTEDKNYVPNRLFFTAHDDAPDQAALLFEFGENEVPGWSNFWDVPSPTAGGFFTAYALSDEYNPVESRLWHFTVRGELELVSGPLPELGFFSYASALDREEKRFAFGLDADGDQFYEVAVTERNGESFGEALIVAEIFDHYESSPGRIVWQP